jgi:hypothetical protein
MQSAVTKPMSNSISNSWRKTSGCWLRVWLACRRKVGRKTSRAAASGRFALVERHLHRACGAGALDAATRFADAALSHDVAYRFFALAAARGHAEFELEFIERIDTFGDERADLSIGDGLADADNHD